MAFELEGDLLQGKNYRDHLNKNWTNGNAAFESQKNSFNDLNARFNDQIAGSTNDNEVIDSRHGFDVLRDNIDSKILVFKSVDDLKKSTDKISEGMIVKTIAYYTSTNYPFAGGAFYYIGSKQELFADIDLGNGLYANLILENERELNVLQCGIEPNSDNDQSHAIQNILTNAPYNYKIYFPAGSYILESAISLKGFQVLRGDTENIHNAAWNGTLLAFKNISSNTTLIDASQGGKQVVENLYITLDSAYSLTCDRTLTKTTTDNQAVNPFTEKITISGIDGIHIGGYGSICKNVVLNGCSGNAIKADAFSFVSECQIFNSQTGIYSLSDTQLSNNRAQDCMYGCVLAGAECTISNDRYDEIGDIGFLLKNSSGTNISNAQVDYAGGAAIALNNSSNCDVRGTVGRSGIKYSNTSSENLDHPENAAGVWLSGMSSNNRIDVVIGYNNNLDSSSSTSSGPFFKIVIARFWDLGDTFCKGNNITITGDELETSSVGADLSTESLKRYLFISTPTTNVAFSGSINLKGVIYSFVNTTSEYLSASISRTQSVNINDSFPLKSKTLMLEGSVSQDADVGSNFDSLTATGIYGFNGWGLSNTANAPTHKDTGILFVVNANDKILHTILGESYIQNRMYVGNSWTAWKTAALT